MSNNKCWASRRSFLCSVAGSLLAAYVPKRELLIGDDMPASSSANRGQNTANSHLKWDVFVTPSIPVVTTDFAPGEHERPWPPIASTLIYGSRDAVVVDSFITAEQANAHADWIASIGRNLTTIYATHGHGDHFFGASILLERFPKARFVAAPSAVEVMKQQVSPDYVAKFWESRFPKQLPNRLVIADELQTNSIDCEGEQLIVVALKFTDTAGTTCLHVPALDLIAAGDAAYNGIHPRLLESNQNHKNDEWLAALDTMQSLKPLAVVAGHKNPKNDDNGLRVIGQTRQYILDFQKLAEKTASEKELYDQMLTRYPDWLNRGALWSSVTAIKK
ncbi:MAG TPA: MBL fold metallo-hydrolase [Candidatus Acidoferrum sp.]|nr:MBL fold metallo-hydrolase [Candidatus Acidoferrum sp.]